VVVNDLGATPIERAPTWPAHYVVARSKAAAATRDTRDIEWTKPRRMVDQASDLRQAGRAINNAGILRDRMMVNMNRSRVDSVIKVT